MNRMIASIIAFVFCLLAQQTIQAQGTVYLSNLGQPSTGSFAVGSNSWLAAIFFTGNNSKGYELNSIQLELTDASGNPGGFTAMIYTSNTSAPIPGQSLGILEGSLDPGTSGVYTYTPASNLALSPQSYYYLVLTGGTAIANGAYEWSAAGTTSYNPSGGWNGFGGGVQTSSNGSSWSGLASDNLQYSIDAQAIPEPSNLSLFALAGLGFFWHRRKIVVRG